MICALVLTSGAWLSEPSRRWVDLKDVQAWPHDREIAEVTRSYYRDQIMMSTLRGQTTSTFRKELYGMVNGEPILSSQMGMLLKLPYFYVEDTTRDGVFSQLKTWQGKQPRPLIPDRVQKTLRPHSKILCSRRGGETYQYWWADEDDRAVLWTVSASNPVRSLIDSLYEMRTPITVSALCYESSQRGTYRDRTHYHLGDVRLVSC